MWVGPKFDRNYRSSTAGLTSVPLTLTVQLASLRLHFLLHSAAVPVSYMCWGGQRCLPAPASKGGEKPALTLKSTRGSVILRGVSLRGPCPLPPSLPCVCGGLQRGCVMQQRMSSSLCFASFLRAVPLQHRMFCIDQSCIQRCRN